MEKKYDTNGDGWIDASEAKAMMKAILRLVWTNGKARVNTPVERQFDGDGNGIISPKEAQAIHEALKEQG